MGRGSKPRRSKGEWIHSTRLHLILYSFLLILTPFILLQNYLVEAISSISGSTFPLATLRVPIVPLLAGVLLMIVVLLYRTRITRWILAAVIIVVLMDAAAQEITDFYFGHKFYDLQQNWHYIAYALFAYMAYRDLSPRRLPLSRILWLTFVSAIVLSSVDEAFQKGMSSRVFDLSDTAKDAWGCLMGMVLITLGGNHAVALSRTSRRLWTAGLREHFRNPLTSLFMMLIFNLIFLSCASLLSDSEYVGVAVGLTLMVFAVFLLVYALLLNRKARVPVAALFLLLIIGLGYRYVQHRDDFSVRNQGCFTIYRGIPIPFFDVLIFPDGRFRLVDKKRYFNSRDQRFFLGQRSDIIVVGSGRTGLGGKGFPETSMVQFVYNPFLGRATQVIILMTPDACRVFSRLKMEKRNVLLVIHNNC
jgi:hypothetical protein